MPKFVFTPHLRAHLDCPEISVEAETLRAGLEDVFTRNPKLRSYVVDEHGVLRKHVVIFIDQVVAKDRRELSDSIAQAREVFVLQALSGG